MRRKLKPETRGAAVSQSEQQRELFCDRAPQGSVSFLTRVLPRSPRGDKHKYITCNNPVINLSKNAAQAQAPIYRNITTSWCMSYSLRASHLSLVRRLRRPRGKGRASTKITRPLAARCHANTVWPDRRLSPSPMGLEAPPQIGNKMMARIQGCIKGFSLHSGSIKARILRTPRGEGRRLQRASTSLSPTHNG